MRTALIDGDILAYVAACKGQDSYGFGIGLSLTAATEYARKWIDSVISATECDTYTLALSDPSHRYFRHDLLPTYKGNRTSGQRPPLLGEVRDWLRDMPESLIFDNCEADDVLGVEATGFSSCESVIVTLDKDLNQIPGSHFNPNKLLSYEVPEEEATRFFYQQALSGDPTDGFKGCPGIGPKKARKIVGEAGDTEQEMWQAVVEAYGSRGIPEADALVQAQVARICRYHDFNFQQMKPTPWQPKKEAECPTL